MTLELKQYPNWAIAEPAPYLLGGVKEITCDTEHGEGYHAITIFDRRVFATECFEFVRNRDTGEYYVKNGKWAYEEKTVREPAQNSHVTCTD